MLGGSRISLCDGKYTRGLGLPGELCANGPVLAEQTTHSGLGLREAFPAAIDGFRSMSDAGLIDRVLREESARSFAQEHSGLYS